MAHIRGEDLSDLQIIGRCFHPDRQVVGGIFEGNFVVKLSDDEVVKFGFGVPVEEFHNQRRAFEMLDHSKIRVPRAHRYFTQPVAGMPDRGFLVMEYIHGEIIESPNSDQIKRIANILSYFATIKSERPGPLQGGVSYGLLWEENGRPSFKSVQDLECWLNIRLPDIDSKLDLHHHPLILCHLDLAPRNILWLDDGAVCFLDWASAGFYPRFFEVCLLRIMTHVNYEKALKDEIDKLTDEEEAQSQLLTRSYYNGIRYSFATAYAKAKFSHA